MARYWGRKDKRKKKAEPNIEFVSPYPLEDCVWQLQNFPGVGEWFPIKTRVELMKLDDETWAFKVYKTYFSTVFLKSQQHYDRTGSALSFLCYFRIEASGQLKFTRSNTTLVIGQASVSRMTVIFNGLLVFTTIAIGVYFISNLGADPRYIFAVLLLATLPISGLTALANRNSYVRTLRSHIKRVLGP
jgi:hypothetical protein